MNTIVATPSLLLLLLFSSAQFIPKAHAQVLQEEAAPSPSTTEDSEDVFVDDKGQCIITSDYPVCTAAVIPLEQKRVRREIRSLSVEAWQKVVDAMWVMKTVDDVAGKATYGDGFRTYDSLVVKHALVATDTRGDQGHFGAHFATWHVGFVLEFEISLLPIDDTIEGAPYWDECNTEPSVFKDEYFGTDPTESPYIVTDGKFANWPVQNQFNISDWSDNIVDKSTLGFFGQPGTTFLRGPLNNVTEEYVIRIGGGVTWENMVTDTCSDDWWACTADDVSNWNDWYACINAGEPSFHRGPPTTIGGVDVDTGDYKQIIRGDFEDSVTSPNSPIFMFHHGNLDRSRMWWINRHSKPEEVCKYNNFPLDTANDIRYSVSKGGANFEGAHLNDVVASVWGFTAAELGIDIGTREYVTHADILCHLSPDAAPYVYDSNIDCLQDSTLCHYSQRLRNTDDDSNTTKTNNDRTTTDVETVSNNTTQLSAFSEIATFSVPQAPSGLYFHESSGLLYVFCGTSDANHSLYTYTANGEEQCNITIPEAVGTTRVDGCYIVDDYAYIVGGQGPTYATDDGQLGISLYEVVWNDPCGCANGTCNATSFEWSPIVLRQWSLIDVSVEGGGDDAFVHSNVLVVKDGEFYARNGVYPVNNGTLHVSYPNSIVKVDMATADIVEIWSLDGDIEIDFKGLSCGADNCDDHLYIIGDGYSFLYKMDLATGAVTHGWNISSIVSTTAIDDKGGGVAFTYSSTTGYFFAAIQQTNEIHVVQLSEEINDFVDFPHLNTRTGTTGTELFLMLLTLTCLGIFWV